MNDQDQTPKKIHPQKSAEVYPQSLQVQLESLKEIVLIQQSVNGLMAGPNWFVEASEHKRVDYTMAILDEASELWRCAINFKFWDKKSFIEDRQNAQMEVIDILHFLISEDLVLHNNDAVRVSNNMYSFVYTFDSLSEKGEDPKPHLKTLLNGITAPKPVVFWAAFWSLAECFGLDMGRAITLYKAKATLNKFRTAVRNANGSYNKVWPSSTGPAKEDNYFMVQWINSQPFAPTDSEILAYLTNTYYTHFPTEVEI